MGKRTPQNYISLSDAAKYCNYSQEYLSLRARQGKIRAEKRGRNWFTTQKWLKEYLRNKEKYSKHRPYRDGHDNGRLKENLAEPISVSDQFERTPVLLKSTLAPSGKEELALTSVKKIIFQTQLDLKFGFVFSLISILLISGATFGRVSSLDFFRGARNISHYNLQALEEFSEWLPRAAQRKTARFWSNPSGFGSDIVFSVGDFSANFSGGLKNIVGAIKKSR